MSTEIEERMSDQEVERLGYLVGVIKHEEGAFFRVGIAVTEIRENRLYRGTHKTFQAFCRDELGWSPQYVNRLIAAAGVVKNLETVVSKLPANESQAKPLTSLTAEEQAEAWQEAVEESNGKPTAAVVQAVVDRKRGKTTINGKHVEDPPEIAKARADGRIPDAADIEIIEPESEEAPAEAVREEYEERKAIQEEISDEEWVAALPLFTQLEGICRDRFVEDAILYRTMTAARKTFAHHATRAFNKVRRKGAYAFRLQSFLGISAPDKWLLCPTVDNEGCGGSGEIHLIGRCPKCHGRGYWIK